MRAEMSHRGWRTYQDAMLDARDLIGEEGDKYGYRHVVVDETQDMGPEALQLIRGLVPENKNDLFFVGDGHQRIYRRRAVMGKCGIHIVGRARKLKIAAFDISELPAPGEVSGGWVKIGRGNRECALHWFKALNRTPVLPSNSL